MASASRASRALVSQLRIVYSELKNNPAASLPPSELLAFGRRYAAEIYLAAQSLRDEANPDEETRAELQRTLWAACVWELSMLLFVGRPALLTGALVPWWQLHLCDRTPAEQALPALEASPSPDAQPSYWPTLRSLVACGLPDLALRLLRRHGALFRP